MTKDEVDSLAQKVFKKEASQEEIAIFAEEFNKILSEVEESTNTTE